MEGVMCKGSIRLGSGCKACSRCFEELEKMNSPVKMSIAMFKQNVEDAMDVSFQATIFLKKITDELEDVEGADLDLAIWLMERSKKFAKQVFDTTLV